MRLTRLKNWLAVLAVTGLVACGGGGGDAGTPILPGSGGGTPGTGSGGTGTTTASMMVSVNLASPTISPANPTTVTVTVRTSQGQPIAGRVVDLSTERTGLGLLGVTSVATDANGTATTSLRANGNGLSGADNVVAVAKLGTTTAQGTAAFTVVGSAPAVDLATSAQTVRGSTGAITLRATLRDATGALVPNTVVEFSSVNGRLVLAAPSAVTDGFGVATVTAAVASASVTAAETVTASASVNGRAVSSSAVLQLVADSPVVTARVSSSTVVPGTGSVFTATVRDTAGALVPDGTIVSFSSTFGLTSFSAATSATQAGVARVTLAPKSADSNGADQVVASATVGGVQVRDAAVVQVSGSVATIRPKLTLDPITTPVGAGGQVPVKATLTDANGVGIPGQVVTFKVVRGLAQPAVSTALTRADGSASVLLAPVSASSAGADEVTATVSYAGTDYQETKGFEVVSTSVSLTGLTSLVQTLGAYGQTTLTVTATGASVVSPVTVNLSSSCVAQGKATMSPASLTLKSGSAQVQYRDNGCGAGASQGQAQVEDLIEAVIAGAATTVNLRLPVASPSAVSLAFVSASPEVIFLKGSGLGESSALVFELRDGAGNPLPNRNVTLRLSTLDAGATLEGSTGPISQQSDAAGRITVRVNSGARPTPIRVSASYTDPVSGATVSTVSSALSASVGLPSQLNFSLSQASRNIEGANIDGTTNTYTILAADRMGNPVPAGTSINFVTEGGQVEAVRQVQLVNGVATTTARFVSADPRPADGRVTVTAYALGEESFVDLNGNNQYDAGEPFQDLGHLYLDRWFDGIYDPILDEYVPTNIVGSTNCQPLSFAAQANALLALDASIPSIGAATCDGRWSRAGEVYVRRAIETVLSTSAARPLWGSKSGLAATSASCTAPLTLQVAASPANVETFNPVFGGTWYFQGSNTGSSVVLPFIVGDANTYPAGHPSRAVAGAVGRLNPMAAGTRITASSPTPGVIVDVVGGSPVPSTTEATGAAVSVTFPSGVKPIADVVVAFTSPSGLATSFVIRVDGDRDTSQGATGTPLPALCP